MHQLLHTVKNSLSGLRLVKFAAPFLLSIATCVPVVACPNCKDAISSGDERAVKQAQGYYYSIIFLLATPATILTVFGLVAYRAVNKAEALRAAEAADNGREPTNPPL